MPPHDTAFAAHLRELIQVRGTSYRRLAAATYLSKTHIGKLATGQRVPHPETAQRLDDTLDAGGSLVAKLPAHRRLNGADAQTADLAVWLGDSGPVADRLTAIGQKTERLALDYLAQGVTLLPKAQELRANARALLPDARTPDQLRDAVLAIGYQSGVLAYLALDVGLVSSALAHADLAWNAAERAGSDQLRAWARGTQSLIARFAGDYRPALQYAEDGLRYATSGTAATRLWCGIAQCYANMADAPAARRALNRAASALESARGVDELPGLFGFSPAKLAYYSGSSLIWLRGQSDNRRARAQAHEAIRLWRASGPEDRSLADEALAHVYAATAALAIGDLEAAVADLEPILGLPPERRISWIVRRLDRVSGRLASRRYAGNGLAAETLERICGYG